MTDISYTKSSIKSDNHLAEQIGKFVKQHRLQQNYSQQALAHAAGISRSTLSILEHGGTVTLATLLQVLRILNQLHFMDFFNIDTSISPLALAKLEKQKRMRVKPKTTKIK